jgi:predicted lipoprotein with Yx(FWY)xxD motif
MFTSTRIRYLAVTVALTLGAAQSQAAPVGVALDPVLGSILVDADGMTVYVFSNDEPGVSRCEGGCAEAWPPLLVDTAADASALGIPGQFGTTIRGDGSTQLTYNGWPLYGWASDAAPGDTSGHLVGGIWWVANLNPVVRISEHPEHGPILVGPDGMTLYLFTNDEPGVSNCYDQCAANWPPLRGGFDEAGLLPQGGNDVGGEIGWIERDDGGRQLTYDGRPLYGWMADRAPGDATGHGVNGVWFVVPPTP